MQFFRRFLDGLSFPDGFLLRSKEKFNEQLPYILCMNQIILNVAKTHTTNLYALLTDNNKVLITVRLNTKFMA